MSKQKRTVWQAEQIVFRFQAHIKTAIRKAAAKDGRSMNAWAEEILARAGGVKIKKEGRR